MEIISSRKNDRVRFLRTLFREKWMRDEHGMFAVEGDHLCGELLRVGLRIGVAAFTEKAAEKYSETVKALCERAEKTLVISEDIAEYISDTKTPQGLFAAAEKREIPFPEDARRLIILDKVQDAGNVGTVIRTAEAFGIDGVLLTDGCADAWSPKAVRASMGSVFREPLIPFSSEEHLEGFTVYGAMLDESAKRLGEVRFPEKTAIVIGSEGSGISPEIAEICDEKIYIPIKGAESLNAAMAAAVLLWELGRS